MVKYKGGENFYIKVLANWFLCRVVLEGASDGPSDLWHLLLGIHNHIHTSCVLCIQEYEGYIEAQVSIVPSPLPIASEMYSCQDCSEKRQCSLQRSIG